MLHDVHERHILSAMLCLLLVLLHLCACAAAYLMHPDFLRKVHRMLHMPVQLASKVRHALCWAQGSTERGDPRIRKVEEDIDGVKQAQLKCQQDLERLMQKKHQSKADMTLLPLLLKQREEQFEEVKQLREKLKLLREKELLLLRQCTSRRNASCDVWG